MHRTDLTGMKISSGASKMCKLCVIGSPRPKCLRQNPSSTTLPLIYDLHSWQGVKKIIKWLTSDLVTYHSTSFQNLGAFKVHFCCVGNQGQEILGPDSFAASTMCSQQIRIPSPCLCCLHRLKGLPICYLSRREPSPPSWCFRGYFNPLFIKLEGITLCSVLLALHKPWGKSQNLILTVVFGFWL